MSITLDKGLPSNVEVERLVLGSVLLNNNAFLEAAAALTAADFSLQQHRCQARNKTTAILPVL